MYATPCRATGETAATGALQQRLADRMGQVPSTAIFRHVCPGPQV
jgi:hypothetical protein